MSTSRTDSSRSGRWTTPRSTVTCASSRPWRLAAIAASWAWIERQACSTELPIRTVERLADVCWSYGTIAVSPMTTVTQSSGAPSSCAAIWAKTVRAPWPMSEVPARTTTLPSPRSRTVEYERPVVGPDLMPTARPRPWPGGRGVSQPMSSAARSTACRQSPSAGVSNGMNASPFFARLRRRISRRSIPIARAASSRFDSTAQFTCGLPKPRNAVDGTVWDRTLRARIRTAGTLYGPAAG